MQMRAGRLRSGDAEHVVDQYCEMCLTPLYRQRLLNVIPPPSDERGLVRRWTQP